MDNSYQQGDLADIVRATATTTTTTTTVDNQMLGWQFEPSNLDPYTYSGPLTPDLSTGLPFVDMGLLQGPMSSVPDPVQDNNTNSANYSITTSTSNTSSSNKFEQNHGYGLVSTEMMSVNGSINGYKDGFIDNTTTTGVHHQIPSPSNTGIKRRKSQAKKVVCIPAPAAANNRQTGEVVPSDLWAWRKYGQKPIKGSPYPRGYYRCSSSKGCSARKQVERSRTDPNMLVITYTSEHNHPWPTQRNALAGSTRSQPSKISLGSTTSPKLSSTVITTNDVNKNDNDNNHTNNNVLVKEEFNNDKNTFHDSNNNNCGNALMKDENVGVEYDKLVESNISRKDVNNNNVVVNEVLLEDVGTSYRPEIPESSSQQQTDHDFFADLVGFSVDDPFNLLFTQENKTFNPFGTGAIFDWAPPNNTNATNNDLDNYSTTYNGQGKGES